MDLEGVWGSTLFHVDDLPFKAGKESPRTCTDYKIACQKSEIREMLTSPKEMTTIKTMSEYELFASEFTPDLEK